jgi:hypothetical protein
MLKNSQSQGIIVSALTIEGKIPQINRINQHRKKWEAELRLNGKKISLDEWDITVDGNDGALNFPLLKHNIVLEDNFGSISKDLIFYTGSLTASDVLLPLKKNGMKAKILASDQEFTLGKDSIKLLNKNLIE